MLLNLELTKIKHKIYNQIDLTATLYLWKLQDKAKEVFIDKKELMLNYLKKRGYVEKIDFLVKDFVYIKIISDDSFIIGHDIPGNKSYYCKIGAFTEFTDMVKYFEKL